MITQTENGYIVAYIAESENDAEYKEAIKVMDTKPPAPEGYDYRLKADSLTWEIYELPTEEEE